MIIDQPLDPSFQNQIKRRYKNGKEKLSWRNEFRNFAASRADYLEANRSYFVVVGVGAGANLDWNLHSANSAWRADYRKKGEGTLLSPFFFYGKLDV